MCCICSMSSSFPKSCDLWPHDLVSLSLTLVLKVENRKENQKNNKKNKKENKKKLSLLLSVLTSDIKVFIQNSNGTCASYFHHMIKTCI